MKGKLVLAILLMIAPLLYGEQPTIEQVTFDEISQAAANICAKLDPNEIDVLVGICSGGLPPTTMFSKYLKNKNIKVISASSYSDKKRGELVITNFPPKEELEGKNILLIDDIADSGRTMNGIKELFERDYNVNRVTTATIYVNTDHCQYYPDYWALMTTHWIEFPWEQLVEPNE